MSITISLPVGYKPVFKHGDHDQSTHGSWATGKAEEAKRLAPDKTEELSSYFGKDITTYKNSEAYKEIQKREEKGRSEKRAWENYVLEIVAEKQGFAETPKVVTADEMDKLQADGWTIAYRGIQDYSHGGDNNINYTSEQLAEEFRTGNYHAGSGVDGDGIYLTTDYEVARSYADDWKTGKQGTVLKVAIPPNSTMDANEFNEILKENREMVRSGKQPFWGADDLGVLAASQGHRGAEHLRNMRVIKNGGRTGFNRIAPVFVIWDRSMLAVQEADK